MPPMMSLCRSWEGRLVLDMQISTGICNPSLLDLVGVGAVPLSGNG